MDMVGQARRRRAAAQMARAKQKKDLEAFLDNETAKILSRAKVKYAKGVGFSSLVIVLDLYCIVVKAVVMYSQVLWVRHRVIARDPLLPASQVAPCTPSLRLRSKTRWPPTGAAAGAGGGGAAAAVLPRPRHLPGDRPCQPCCHLPLLRGAILDVASSSPRCQINA
jgi:hypothetical protein